MRKSISCTNYSDYAVIEILIEKFDFFQTPDISHQIDAFFESKDFPHLIFDFENLTYIDSSGIGYLLNLRKETIKYGSEIVLICNDKELLRVMEVSKLTNFFKICANRDEAVALISNLS